MCFLPEPVLRLMFHGGDVERAEEHDESFRDADLEDVDGFFNRTDLGSDTRTTHLGRLRSGGQRSGYLLGADGDDDHHPLAGVFHLPEDLQSPHQFPRLCRQILHLRAALGHIQLMFRQLILRPHACK